MLDQPVGQLAVETFGPNSYNPCSYVYNNPINTTDPSGLRPPTPPKVVPPPAGPTTGICARVCSAAETVGSWVILPVYLLLDPLANTCADAEWHPKPAPVGSKTKCKGGFRSQSGAKCTTEFQKEHYCPDFVEGDGDDRQSCQKSAEETAPEECRQCYGHFRFW
jgi:hypothetical protein